MFEKKHMICCKVNTCKFHDEDHCLAEKVEVACDCCTEPLTDHETACRTFCHK